MYDQSLRADSLMSEQESEKIQISIGCRKLDNLDTFTSTNSFLIVNLQELNKPSRKILQTKVYRNDLNPNYAQSVIIDYFFQIRQKLIFQVYHQGNPSVLVGRFLCSVGQVFGSPDNGLLRPIVNKQGKQAGKIVIKCQKVQKTNTKQMNLKVRARDLPSTSSFLCFSGSNYPFFRVFRNVNNQQLLVYQSEHTTGRNDYSFQEFTLSERRLAKNMENQPFQIRFYNYSDMGHHKYIGTATVTISQLAKQKKSYIIEKDGKNKGTLILDKINRFTKLDFGSYIQAGLQLALVTCIDFTASNGIYKQPDSLHYSDGYKLSPYAEALCQVSRILLDYDYDKLVPVFGFGAKVGMPNFNSGGKTHHCFPINGNLSNPNLYQVDGILQQYRNCLRFLQFSGPTKFSGLLQQAIIQCKQAQKTHSKYMILFILTDGQIHDKKEVIDQIIQCGTLPMSIIIVGIGNGDFGVMRQLDDDNCKLIDSKGRKTQRDLVQFVEFSKFKNNGVQLAKEVLQQLPRQVVQYFQLVNIAPENIPKPKTDFEFQQQLKHMIANNVNGPNYGYQNSNIPPPLYNPNNFDPNSFQIPPGMNPNQQSNHNSFLGPSRL